MVFLLVLLSTALATPGRAFDPAIDTWSRTAMEDGARVVKDRPLASLFLGETAGMRPYNSAHQAWFADSFRLANYTAIDLPAWTNSIGRFHVTGQELMRQGLAASLNGLKPWRGSVLAAQVGVVSSGAELTIYGNVHQFKNTANDLEYVMEFIAVDAAGMVQFKIQDIIGSSGTADIATAGASALLSSEGNLLSAGVAMAMAMPTDRDQFEFYEFAAAEVGRRVMGTLYAADRQLTKGKGDVPHSPAVPLTVDRAGLVDARAESFGPTLAAQVASYAAIVTDPAARPDDRADRLRDLGKIGALAAVPVAMAILKDDKADNNLQENAAWALGEIGHPDALLTLESCKGVDKFNVRAAVSKIAEY